jgi:hypothetical protein
MILSAARLWVNVLIWVIISLSQQTYNSEIGENRVSDYFLASRFLRLLACNSVNCSSDCRFLNSLTRPFALFLYLCAVM